MVSLFLNVEHKQPGARLSLLVLCVLLICELPALPLCKASEISSQALSPSLRSRSDSDFETPIGLGATFGTAGGKVTYGAVVESENHFTQRPGPYGIRRYGEGEARLEAGNGLGVALSAITGVTLFGINEKHRSRFSPYFGVEPLSGRITWNSSDNRHNYYEWLPMVSAGLQLASGSCRFLPLIRRGGAAGNIAKTGWSPGLGLAYGAGAFLDCFGFDLAAAETSIQGSAQNVDLASLDLSYTISLIGPKIGLRGENEFDRSSHAGPFSPLGPGDRKERRILLVIRTTLGD